MSHTGPRLPQLPGPVPLRPDHVAPHEYELVGLSLAPAVDPGDCTDVRGVAAVSTGRAVWPHLGTDRGNYTPYMRAVPGINRWRKTQARQVRVPEGRRDQAGVGRAGVLGETGTRGLAPQYRNSFLQPNQAHLNPIAGRPPQQPPKPAHTKAAPRRRAAAPPQPTAAPAPSSPPLATAPAPDGQPPRAPSSPSRLPHPHVYMTLRQIVDRVVYDRCSVVLPRYPVDPAARIAAAHAMLVLFDAVEANPVALPVELWQMSRYVGVGSSGDLVSRASQLQQGI